MYTYVSNSTVPNVTYSFLIVTNTRKLYNIINKKSSFQKYRSIILFHFHDHCKIKFYNLKNIPIFASDQQ